MNRMMLLIVAACIWTWLPATAQAGHDSDGAFYGRLRERADDLRVTAEAVYSRARAEQGRTHSDRADATLARLRDVRDSARELDERTAERDSLREIDETHRELMREIDRASGGVGYFSKALGNEFRRMRRDAVAFGRMLDEREMYGSGTPGGRPLSYREMQAAADRIDLLARRIDDRADDRGGDATRSALERLRELKIAAANFRSQVEKYRGDLNRIDEEYAKLRRATQAARSEIWNFERSVTDDYTELARLVQRLGEQFEASDTGWNRRPADGNWGMIQRRQKAD